VTATATPLLLPADPEIVADTAELSRSDWLGLRREGIGGSDAAAIAGLNPWKSAFSVYLDKTGQAPPDEDSEAAYWGRELEPFVTRRFAQETGRHVIEFPRLLRSRTVPFAMANVDRLSAETTDSVIDAVVEAKTTSAYNRDYDQRGEGMDAVPDAAAIQTQHYMLVTGLQLAYVAVLIGGQRFRFYRVDRDDDLISHLLQIEGEFWQRVIDKVPPAPDAAAKDLLAHLYDVKVGSVVQLDERAGEIAELVRQRQQAKEAIKSLELVADDAQAKLCALLGENEIGTVGGEPAVTWKKSDRAGYSVAPKTGIRTFNVIKRYGESVLRSH
jgi:putative phage-type endonuclease